MGKDDSITVIEACVRDVDGRGESLEFTVKGRVNLASIHRLTGRMRKARRRGRPHLLRAGIAFFLSAVSFPIAAVAYPRDWGAVCLLFASFCWVYGMHCERREHVYQRVVDRCQGGILVLLARRPLRAEELLVRGVLRESDRRRWS